jgi:hypothetical protein
VPRRFSSKPAVFFKKCVAVWETENQPHGENLRNGVIYIYWMKTQFKL